MTEPMSKRVKRVYGCASIVLWFISLWMIWHVDHRLAWAFIVGSMAFNLSEAVRDGR